MDYEKDYEKIEFQGYPVLIPKPLFEIERTREIPNFKANPEERKFSIYRRNMPHMPQEIFENNPIVIDICSGNANLDEIAKKSQTILRVDPIYLSKDAIEYTAILSKENNYIYNPSSAHKISISDNFSDITLEHCGIGYYISNILVGENNSEWNTHFGKSIHLSDFIKHNKHIKQKATNGFYFLMQTLTEKMRITKHGGHIAMQVYIDKDGGHIREHTRPIFADYIFKPTLELWKKEKIVDFNHTINSPTAIYETIKKL